MTKRKSDFTLQMNSLDELFSSQEERDDAKLERVKEIPLTELHPFKDHPFKIQNDDEMKRLMESIQKFGTLTPALARPLPEGGYELISGHRRLAACQVLGIETMPVIIREMSDDEAVIAMVDANLQRETILPSEKAFAYKMKLEAIKHQGGHDGNIGINKQTPGAVSWLRLRRGIFSITELIGPYCLPICSVVSVITRKTQKTSMDSFRIFHCCGRSRRS